MKNCLLLSGIARHVEQSYSSILKSLIEPNNPDIFIHTWLDVAKDPNLAQTIMTLYNPKKVIFENFKTFKNTKLDMNRMMASHGRSYKRDYFVEAFYSAWYSSQQSNLLKEQYRLENDFTYDYTIRARFDITYNMVINCKDYDPNILNISGRELPPEMIDDRFGFGSNYLMNIYCGGFNSIDYIYNIRDKKDGILCGEVLLYELCKMYSIDHKKINTLQCHHLNVQGSPTNIKG